MFKKNLTETDIYYNDDKTTVLLVAFMTVTKRITNIFTFVNLFVVVDILKSICSS